MSAFQGVQPQEPVEPEMHEEHDSPEVPEESEELEEPEESEEENQHPLTVVSKIVSKWLEQGTFIRCVDGDVSNCAACNLQFVSLRDALERVGTWKVDWDMNLTKFECGVVETLGPLLIEKYEGERDGVRFFKIAPKTLSDHIAGSMDDHPNHAPDEACPVCEALKSAATTCSDTLDMNSLFAYTYSSTERGPLSNTSFILANVSVAASQDTCEAFASSVLYLHHRALQGYPIEEHQMFGSSTSRLMLVRASSEDFVKLRSRGHGGIVSDAFMEAERLGEARILFALPIFGGENKDDATFTKMQRIVADFSCHQDCASGLWGSSVESTERRIALCDHGHPRGGRV